MCPRVKVVVAAGLWLALYGIAPTALAEPASLRAFLFGAGKGPAEAPLPSVGRYLTERGEGFVLDRSTGRRAVLKFDDRQELWALTPTPGPRGDVIYRNDVGEPMLRATRLGGLTLFTSEEPAGTAAAVTGLTQRPQPPPVYGPEALLQVLVQASARASRAAQHIIVFDSVDAVATPTTEPVFADAFVLTADAIVRVSTRGSAGHAAVSRIFKVHFIQGQDAAAALIGRIVQVTIAPDLGVAGRPSSDRIADAIARR